jgi:hypothetical protein
MYVMTLTSVPFLPLSRPWAGLSVLVHLLLQIKDHQSSSPYLIFSVSSGCMLKFDPEYFWWAHAGPRSHSDLMKATFITHVEDLSKAVMSVTITRSRPGS